MIFYPQERIALFVDGANLSLLQPLVDYNGFAVVTKPTKQHVDVTRGTTA